MGMLYEDSVPGTADISGTADPVSTGGLPKAPRAPVPAAQPAPPPKPPAIAQPPQDKGNPDTGTPPPQKEGMAADAAAQAAPTEVMPLSEPGAPAKEAAKPTQAISPIVNQFRLGSLLPPLLDPQGTWDHLQTLGHALNAAFDPNAVTMSVQSIEHDKSTTGQIAAHLVGISQQDDPTTKWVQEEAMPWVLTAMASWEPWAFVPEMASQGPQNVAQVPAAALGSLIDFMNMGKDIALHPQLGDLGWWERMGAMTVAATVAAREGPRAAQPFLKAARGIPGLDAFAAATERYVGGPKAPALEVKLGEGAPKFDPPMNADQQAQYAYFDQKLQEMQPTLKALTDVPKPEVGTATRTPEGEISVSFPSTQKAVDDLGQQLGLPKGTARDQVEASFKDAAAAGLDPRLTRHFLDNYQQYANAFGWKDPVYYQSEAEAPFRNPVAAINRIPDSKLQGHAVAAFQAAHDITADLHEGPWAVDHEFTDMMAKGILNTDRASTQAVADFRTSMANLLGKNQAASTRVLDAVEQPGLYEKLAPHEQAAVDLYRRVMGEWRIQATDRGLLKGAQSDFVPRSVNRGDQKALSQVSADALGKVKSLASQYTGSGGGLLGGMRQQSRSMSLAHDPATDTFVASTAHSTVHDANAARGRWRDSLIGDIRDAAQADPELAKVVGNEKLLNAVVQAEIPDFHTDILSVLQSDLGRRVSALHTHDIVQTGLNSLVKAEDGRWHPLVLNLHGDTVAANPLLDQHFQQLHTGQTTASYFTGGLGYRHLDAPGLEGTLWHPSLADPLSKALNYATPDAGWKFISNALIRLPQKLIMWNPLWHGGNGIARLAGIGFSHPLEFARTLAQLPAFQALRGMSKDDAYGWWRAQRRDYLRSGGIMHLPEDVSGEISNFHMQATGDQDMGEATVTRQPVPGFTAAVADKLGAVEGGLDWWHTHVNQQLWNQFDNFGTFAYVLEKNAAKNMGMGDTAARLMGASRANTWKGTVSPDRWMYNPTLQQLSRGALFAPGWWRTYARLLTGSYDSMGLHDPNIAKVWGRNTIQTLAGMYIAKQVTSNVLNLVGSGRLMAQNPDGYKDKVTLDNFFPVDKTNGAHQTVDQVFGRQEEDLFKALGLSEGVQRSGELIQGSGIPKTWKPGYAAAGTAQVAAARASPLISALWMASNVDLYRTVQNGGNYVAIDPTHPGILNSPAAAALSATQLSPIAMMVQAGLESGMTGTDTTLKTGPLAGTTVPAWAARALNLNNPLSYLGALFGVRGPYPSSVSTPGTGESTYQANDILQASQAWQTQQTALEAGVIQGKYSLYKWNQDYHTQATNHANLLKGMTAGIPGAENGASGLYNQYQALYDAPGVKDPVTGDLDYAALKRKQDALLATADPATIKLFTEMQHKQELAHPILRVYHDSVDAYHTFQDQYAASVGTDGETLRSLISAGYSAPDRNAFDAANPVVSQFRAEKERWELGTSVGFIYGLFNNQAYVMNYAKANNINLPTYDAQVIQAAADQQKATG